MNIFGLGVPMIADPVVPSPASDPVSHEIKTVIYHSADLYPFEISFCVFKIVRTQQQRSGEDFVDVIHFFFLLCINLR